MPVPFSRLSPLLALVLCTACGGDSAPTVPPTPPPPPIPVATQLGFGVAPADLRTQAIFAVVLVVEVRDAAGARVTGSSAPITLTVTGGTTGAALRGTRTVSAVKGVATFPGLSIDSAGPGYQLAASTPGLTSATSVAFAVVRGTPTLAFRTQPVGTEAGLALATQPVVEIRDSITGGLLTDRGDTVRLVLAPNAGGGTLPAAVQAVAVAGVATFTGVSVSAPGTGYVLTASGTGLTAAPSAAFTVTAIQTTLTIVSGTTQSGVAGAALPLPIRVRVTRVTGGAVVVGQAVTFAPSGGGSVAPVTPVLTTATGEAQATWTLGTTGAQTVVATTAGAAASVTFSATVTVAAAGLLATQLSTVEGFATCAIRKEGGAVCWGRSVRGELGSGPTSVAAQLRNRPTAVSGTVLTQVSAGLASSCGLTSAGRARCWGSNSNGGLGNGTTTNADVPVDVLGERTYRQIATGGRTTCALTTDNDAFCWGSNGGGEIGNGVGGRTADNVLRPTAVFGGRKYTQIAVGPSHACALDAAGQAWCWGGGLESANQLLLGLGIGNGALQGQPLPVAVQQATGVIFTAIFVGDGTTCAIARTSQQMYCWGYNFLGSLGDGTTTNRAAPVAVLGGVRFVSGATSSSRTCGVSTDGRGYCWGNNSMGLLGDGTGIDTSQPGLIAGDRRWTQLATGLIHTCGIEATTERTFCWGRVVDGRLGDGVTTSTTTTNFVSTPQLVVSPIP